MHALGQFVDGAKKAVLAVPPGVHHLSDSPS